MTAEHGGQARHRRGTATRSTTACSARAKRRWWAFTAARAPTTATLSRLGELAGDGVQVLLYDQLGSGKSDRPDDPSLWVVPRFVEELETVRPKLELGPVHLWVSPGAASSRCSTRSTIPRA